ncbi:MAG TPA: cobalamin-dependent protein, partial [Arenicellales bacterium]|nr:cobalamin-dependent protein [Arenicellales bacterium]
MTSITLATINAKYMHASLGLRYLYANLGRLQRHCRIAEFTINERAVDIVERLLADRPRIIGLGVYIWNAAISAEVVGLIKAVRPETVVVLGGPEVSYEQDHQPIVRAADYVIPGMADLEFARLCGRILEGSAPAPGVLATGEFDIRELSLPYRWYTARDIDERLIYVEASRGCPFKCEFCLSALDRTAWPFDLDAFLEQMH